MRSFVTFVICAFLVPVLSFAAEKSPAAPLLIPEPQSVTMADGTFTLTENTVIVADSVAKPAAEILANQLSNAIGYRVAVTDKSSSSNAIHLRLDASITHLGTEGYRLISSGNGVEITAPQYAGLFNGTQTLLQLFPAKVYSQRPATNVAWTIPALKIEDQPRYAWRGMMLDVARYFMDKEFVLRYLDIMAAHKLNTLHFHLTDDCGWRVEIKKYPLLTEIGGFRGEGPARQGGFYTQQDIREIVAYAKARNIEIVPEIELPAHALAAIAAYPWLSCTGKQHVVPAVHFISDDLYCAGKESTWKFLHDVMDEFCELFPSKIIHIGGDEAKFNKWKACPHCQAKIKELGLKNEKALQGWMTTQVEEYLRTKGRIILGWDEILRAGVSNTAAIMPWYDKKAAFDSASNGHPVVMALTRHTYIDTPETRDLGEVPGATWLPAVSLSDAYNWNPTPSGLTPEQEKNILGAQGCLWSDMFLHKPFLTNMAILDENRAARYLEYLTLPRAAALAEVTWTPREKQNFDDFQRRLSRQYARYTYAGWHYRLPIPSVTFTRDGGGKITATATTPVEGGTLRYTTDGAWPLAYSPVYQNPVTVEKESNFLAVAVAPDGKHISLPFIVKAADQRFAKYGEKIGEWKSRQIGNKKAKIVEFDVTGKINQAGTYEITFLYTGGTQRLDIDSVEVYLNQDLVAKDVHHGFTGGQAQNNTYTLKVDRYETGAAFKVRAAIYGDEGDDSNGVVMLKKK
ncbi:MAG: family 20 glycosylhydrolase [Puniceicoccales bacterium]|jgi:hexosaminidase|nr:family 20 glycosylhydrolase [Puniceicoccales bacterium]